MNSDSKILVTGADGFIGSHLCEALVRQGYRVRAMVMYNAFGSHGWLDQASDEIKNDLEFFPADIRDYERVREACQKVTHLVHLASLIGIPYSYHAPASYVDTNVTGTLNLLGAARDASMEQFIHTSTSEVYGSALRVPMDESHPQIGQSPYAASKIGADQMAGAYYRSFGLPVCILRPFNTYGPRQSARAVIPTIIGQIASGKTTLDLGNTVASRDLTFVTDIVSGFTAALDNKRTLGQVINLGSGHDISIESLAFKIAKLMDTEINIKTDPQRVRPESSEVTRLVCDSSRAAELTGWRPSISLDEGLSRTIAFFKNVEHPAVNRPDSYEI